MIAVVLAAGESKRFGAFKSLVEIEGIPMIAKVLRALPQECSKYVVVGAQKEKLLSVLQSEGVKILENSNYKLGIHSSVEIAVSVAIEKKEDLLLTLADLPFVDRKDYQMLMKNFKNYPLFSSFAGEIGPPALFPLSFLVKIPERPIQKGLKSWIENPQLIEIANARFDVDRPSDLMPPK